MDKELREFFGIPPPLLCKYLPPERVDVLERQRIRFTPMLETNDRFEIRRTFEVAFGAKADVHFEYAFSQINIEEITARIAAQMGRDPALIDHEQIREFAKRLVKDNIVPAFNKPENVEAFLLNVGGRSCALSLSEDALNPSMWDRYASGWKGFVLFLDTKSTFFRRDERGRDIKPEKVRYSDQLDEELVTDIRAPLLTKLPVWSNESEWRLIVDKDNFSGSDDEKVAALCLRPVPPEVFSKVLLGPDSSNELADQIRALKAERLPHLELCRARTERLTGQVREVPLEL